MGGSTIRLNGGKALAESRLILLSRARLGEVEVDITCYGRFYDRFVTHDGAWTILWRNVIYEKDRIDPLRPGGAIAGHLERRPIRDFHVGFGSRGG